MKASLNRKVQSGLTRFRAGVSRTRTESFVSHGPLGASVITLDDVWATPFEGVVPPEGKPGHKTAREIRRRRMWLRQSWKQAADASLGADVPWTGLLVDGGGAPLARISAGISHHPVPESKKRKRGQRGFGARWSRVSRRAVIVWALEQSDDEDLPANPSPPPDSQAASSRPPTPPTPFVYEGRPCFQCGAVPDHVWPEVCPIYSRWSQDQEREDRERERARPFAPSRDDSDDESTSDEGTVIVVQRNRGRGRGRSRPRGGRGRARGS